MRTLSATRGLLLGSLLLFAHAAHAAYNPATGPIGTGVSFSFLLSGQSGPYSLTKSATSVTVLRPGAPAYTYNAGPNGVLSWAFLATDFLLVQETRTDPVTESSLITQVDLRGTGSAQTRTIIDRTDFASDQPDVRVLRNADGMAIFTKSLLKDATINDTFDLDIRRTDTGEVLCSAGDINRDPASTQISAQITGTSAVITITGPFGSTASCPLPVADLTVSPDPVAFGSVLNTTTPTATVTLANPGSNSLVVNSVSSSAHCQPQGLATPITLDSGDATTFSIRLSPSGATGLIDELLPIDRTPAVGASAIRCLATATAPAPGASVSTTSVAFGRVELGTTAMRSFTIGSSGTLPLALALDPSTPSSPAYSVTPAPFSQSLAPGSSQTFQVRFTPTAEVDYLDSIAFTTNDPGASTIDVVLTGRGHVRRPLFDLGPDSSSVDYGDLEVGYRFGKPVRILNRGDADLHFDVEVTGDPRFSFSDDVQTPGVGQRTRRSFTIPATSFGGPARERVLRVTFDAEGPTGGPYEGQLEITNIDDHVDVPVDLSGSVVPGKTLDVSLVLDRSGSMSESTPRDTKIGAVQKASTLFYQLLRADVGDRASLVRYNTMAQTLKGRTVLTEAERTDFIDQVNTASNLTPSGGTSIAAGLLEGFTHVDDPARDVRAVVIVSDGKENTPAPGGETLDTIDVPAGVGVHALGLGREDNLDRAKLEDIAARSGGMSLITGDLEGLDVFGVEKFFLQVATTLLGGTTALDPLYAIAAGQELETVVPIIDADREITFVLLFKGGLLPFQIESPNGALFPSGAPPAGFGEDLFLSPDGAIVRILVPQADPGAYVGEWRIRVRHEGFLAHPGATTRSLAAVSEFKRVEVKGVVDYAVYVGLRSNLRLLGLLSPQPVHVGEPIQVTGFLSEEGVPVRHATTTAQVTAPDGTQTSVTLHDDGAHNDGAAEDGEYGGLFTATQRAGGHSFRIRATGLSARGRPFIRETSLGKVVLRHAVEGAPADTCAPLDACCKRQLTWLRILALLSLLILLCCLFRAVTTWRVRR